MAVAIRLLPTAMLALSLLHSASGAYAADALVPSESSLPDSPALATGIRSAEPAPFARLPAHRSVEQTAAEVGRDRAQDQALDSARDQSWRNQAWRNRWLISLAPLVASQSLDAASSFGLRELNPILAGPDGRFGMKATSIKFAVIGGLMGVEYLVVKKFPASAKLFTVVNYTTAGITTGLAVHNYRLPGR